MNSSSVKIVAFSSSAFVAIWLVSITAFAKHSPHAITSTKSLKNLAREGDVQLAMGRAQQIMDDLREKNWNWNEVNRSLLHLPDQEYAEIESRRGDWQYSFYPPIRPYQEGVVFYSNLYARRNLSIRSGVEGVTNPEGFFIVGWRDGRITQVPVQDIRYHTISQSRRVAVFPGMSLYRADSTAWGR